MATDTIESLRVELDLLRTEFEQFKAQALPVIEGHQQVYEVQIPSHPMDMTQIKGSGVI